MVDEVIERSGGPGTRQLTAGSCSSAAKSIRRRSSRKSTTSAPEMRSRAVKSRSASSMRRVRACSSMGSTPAFSSTTRSEVGRSMNGALVLPEGTGNVARRGSVSVSPRLRLGFVDALLEHVPPQRGALDAHRELHDPLEGLEVAQADVLELVGEIGLLSAFELRLVDRQQRLERTDDRAHLVDRLALDRRAHHRRGRL